MIYLIVLIIAGGILVIFTCLCASSSLLFLLQTILQDFFGYSLEYDLSLAFVYAAVFALDLVKDGLGGRRFEKTLVVPGEENLGTEEVSKFVGFAEVSMH